MFDKLLFIFLILSPICYSGGEDLFQYASRFLMTGTMALASFALIFCKPKRHILPIWPTWFILFCIFKLYYFPYHWLSMHALFNTFFALGIFYLVANYAENIKWLYRAVGIVIMLNIIYGICNYYGYNPIFKYRGLPAGFFSSNSDLAGYLILATPLMAHYLRGLGFLPPFMFIAIMLQSYTAIACGVMAGSFLFLQKRLTILMTLCIIFICLVGFSKQTYNISHKFKYRAEIWQEVAKAAFRRPLVGYKIGTMVEITSTAGQGAFTAKSEYLEFAGEVGIATALVIVGFIFYTLFQRYIHALKSWDLHLLTFSLLSFALALIVQSHLRNPKISPTVMSVLSWFYILTEQRKKEV